VIKFVVYKIESPIQARLVEALVSRGSRYVTRPEMLEIGTEINIVADDANRDSGSRIHRADVALRIVSRQEVVARLLVEADGAAFHSAVNDAARDARLAEQGWPTIRFTGSQINREPSSCADKAFARLDELAASGSEKAWEASRRARVPTADQAAALAEMIATFKAETAARKEAAEKERTRLMLERRGRR
jgi:hypothetical protein